MRARRGNRILSGLGMPGVGNFDTLWQQAFPAALTSAAENGAPALGLHPCAKTKLSFARPLAWLVSAFHRALKNGSALGYVFVSHRQERQQREALLSTLNSQLSTLNSQLSTLNSQLSTLRPLTAARAPRFGRVPRNRSSEAPDTDRFPSPPAR
jgi:hypothetical protein